MKVTIYTVDGGEVEIGDMDLDGAMEMAEALGNADSEVLAFSLDDGAAQTFILRRNICRIDIEGAPGDD